MVSNLCLKIFIQQFVHWMIRVFTDQVQNYNNYFGISITLTNINLTYRHLKRGNQCLEAMSNRSRSHKSIIYCFYVPIKNISLSSRSRIFHFHNWLIIYGFTSRSRIFHLYADVNIEQKRYDQCSTINFQCSNNSYSQTSRIACTTASTLAD
jgi:hypothetical protein